MTLSPVTYIDHTLLASHASAQEVELLCKEAITFGFATVCINPNYVQFAADLLKGHRSQVCTVSGFPFGTNHIDIKRAETEQAIFDGANEVDGVILLPALLAGDSGAVLAHMKALSVPCKESNVVSKIILETAALTNEHIIMACQLANDVGIDFIKTSTGMHQSGSATIAAVKLMDQYRGHCKIKAAGGIRNRTTFDAMIEAGADRIGTSASVAIMNDFSG